MEWLLGSLGVGSLRESFSRMQVRRAPAARGVDPCATDPWRDDMEPKKEKKVKKIKELFVQDLARIEGGAGPVQDKKCPEITTFACGEEPPGCSAC
jgi:hypothetical protein